jgi:hypothetical protein
VAGSFFDRHLVWWSSRESIAAEKTSLLAVAEVIFSVAAYWGIAWYFDTYAHLLISILVAPLVRVRALRLPPVRRGERVGGGAVRAE